MDAAAGTAPYCHPDLPAGTVCLIPLAGDQHGLQHIETYDQVYET